MYKDQVYFKGAVAILKNRKSINFKNLYSGKLNLEDCKRLTKDKLLNKSGLVYPYFMKDENEYHRVLDIIAKCNFIP